MTRVSHTPPKALIIASCPIIISYSETELGEPSLTKKDIIIRDIIALRGPNIWTYRPVFEAWIDIGEFEDYPSNKLPGFTERLTALLPSLIEHQIGRAHV